MLQKRTLAFRLPLAAAALLLLGGCYTVLRHPATDLTESAPHQGDYRYSDCASCHADGFGQPLVVDPYGYATSSYWSYYGRPWWLPDYGGWSRGPGGGGGGDGYGPPETARDDQGRRVGNRGAAHGLPRMPNMGVAPGGGASASPGGGPDNGSPATTPATRPKPEEGVGNRGPASPTPTPGDARPERPARPEPSGPSSQKDSTDTGKKSDPGKKKDDQAKDNRR